MVKLSIFDKYPELVYGFSEVSDGNMAYVWGKDSPEEVEQNRSAFCKKIGTDIDKVTAVALQHGNEVIIPTQANGGVGMHPNSQDIIEADGLITNQKGVGMCFIIADCMPVVVYDPANHAVGLFHAGRRGVEKDILEQGIKLMAKEYGSKAKDLMIGVGPAISTEDYGFEHTKELDTKFWGDRLKRENDGLYHMDIKNRLKDQAIELGVQPQNIEICSVNTFTDKNFFSHRRSAATGETEGRFAAIVYLK